MLPGQVKASEVEVWFEDELRAGQQGTMTRVWAGKGTRPRVARQQQFIAAYIFGAVCPGQDKGAAIVMPYADTEAMQWHLEEISANVAPGKHAVVVLDQAGWHHSHGLRPPPNLSLLPLPAHSPELNPEEQAGRHMRETHLANRTFKDYDEIKQACSEAWNSLVDTPGQIRSLCSRNWAKL